MTPVVPDRTASAADTVAVPRPPSRRAAVAQLARAQKSNRGAAGYSRWVNRPAGRQLAAVASQLPVTPNQVSVISAVFTFASIAALALVRPGWLLGVAVTLGLLVGYALDSADGQLARLRGGGSVSGEWLDHVLDAAKIPAFHLAIVISWYRYYALSHAATLLVPLAFTLVATVFFFALILADLLRRIVGAGPQPVAAGVGREAAPVLRSLIVLPNDYGVLCLTVLLLAAHAAFITVYSVLLAANVVFLLVGCARWYRELSTLRRR